MTPPDTLNYTIYKVCATVRMLIELRFKAVECGYFKVEPTPLETSLTGGDIVQTGNFRDVR